MVAGSPAITEGRARRKCAFAGSTASIAGSKSRRRRSTTGKRNLVRWCGINTDIDDLKCSEQKLREDEADLRTITDAIRQVDRGPGARWDDALREPSGFGPNGPHGAAR